MKRLIKFGHEPPKRPQHCPYTPSPIQYGKRSQNTTPEDDSPRVGPKEKKYIQEVVGSFLFYGRATDTTILTALSAIASEQEKPTEKTMQRVKQFLDYMWTHPDAEIEFRASDMILNVHSDASYLSAPKARSRAGGYYFLGSVPRDNEPIFLNGERSTFYAPFSNLSQHQQQKRSLELYS